MVAGCKAINKKIFFLSYRNFTVQILSFLKISKIKSRVSAFEKLLVKKWNLRYRLFPSDSRPSSGSGKVFLCNSLAFSGGSRAFTGGSCLFPAGIRASAAGGKVFPGISRPSSGGGIIFPGGISRILPAEKIFSLAEKVFPVVPGHILAGKIILWMVFLIS